MKQQQIDYYNSLSNKERRILDVAALKGSSISYYSISSLVSYSMSQTKMNALLYSAMDMELFKVSGSWRGDFEVTPAFFIYILPSLEPYVKTWNKIRNDYFGYSNSIAVLRDYLFSLLFATSHLDDYTQKIQHLDQETLTPFFVEMLGDERYRAYLPTLPLQFMPDAIGRRFFLLRLQMTPIEELQQYLVDMQKLFPDIALMQQLQAEIMTLYAGRFDLLITNRKEATLSTHFFTFAVGSMIKGDATDAFAQFEKGIRLQRKEVKGSFLPLHDVISFFYLVALMSVESEKTMPIMRKLLIALKKEQTRTFSETAIRMIIHKQLNQKAEAEDGYNVLYDYVQESEYLFHHLVFIAVHYIFSDHLPEDNLDRMLAMMKKGYLDGYLVQTYEAAYALSRMTDDPVATQYYLMLQDRLNYPPILSLVKKQEAWELPFNELLSLKKGSVRGRSAASETESRVVYHLIPESKYIQPVLQTRGKSGWSKGRNIALKTFFEGTTKGMTEQDFRVSKTVVQDSSYYNTTLYLPDRALVELIGHPYLFLDSTLNISMELVEATPVISIKKSGKGYQIKTDLTSFTPLIQLVKETNTRYKVYHLTTSQQQIIQIINKQNLVIPASGKEKLMDLLALFHQEGLTVHSDLLATPNAKSEVKEVKADERLRVQLLPLGDGLKAEIFAKPFGTHPPYVKPGKGGQVLIANENHTQLQVKRNLTKEREYESILMNAIQQLGSFEINDGLISFDDPRDSLFLLEELTKHQEIAVVEWPEGERFKVRGVVDFSNMKLKIKSNVDWFGLEGELRVDEEKVISLQQLMQLTKQAHGRFIELQPGEFLALSEKLRKQLMNLQAFAQTDKKDIRINKPASLALGGLFDQIEDLKSSKGWNDFRKRVQEAQEKQYALPANLMAELRPYQEEGFRWLARLAEWEGGGCLADDMGLGKTIQTLALLLHRSAKGPALVVCPVSVVHNWQNEVRRFAPSLQVKTFLGGNNRKEVVDSLEAGDLLILSYGLLQTEEELLTEREFSTIVLDEAHTIKNFATKTTKATMRLKGNVRVALTGTPVQNNLSEIWSLFSFLNPGMLGTLKHFTDTFIKPDDAAIQKQLKRLLSPFILRRTKTAVLDELPPKTEIVQKVQLSEEEMAFYEVLRRQALQNISSDDSSAGAAHLRALAEITRLRQACCNPKLIDPKTTIKSAKLTAFMKIVGELKQNKHRALVFSQFVSHLAIVREALDKEGYSYMYLDGSTPQAKRAESVKRFQHGEGDFFLISLKAGGLGLNLTAADYVIHLDPWWNPAVEDQASDRAHRIGQTRPVTIYRMVAEQTIEEKIIQLHHTKRDMAETLLEGSDRVTKLSLDELLSLIQESREL
ncbi:DEAD/DEAH box helicase [Parabacteroides sp. OttesenSCG-928-N08]|nr:DEAD/DEAH box helicase [Parabacteroides sp. OttesenSCG-928-N08]